jgi:anaerobic selenocysteine-containing dehydrogenase
MIKLEEELKKGISRRAFNAGALAAAATLVGCGGGGESDTIVIGGTVGGETGEPEVAVERVYGSGAHNCGGRCVSVAEVVNGRIVRVVADEGEFASDGTYLNPESRNIPQNRPCARCHSYRYRQYHTGRLLYPLKQTKKRGDLTGFVRISWEQALDEIAQKQEKVLSRYVHDGIYNIYACGTVSNIHSGFGAGMAALQLTDAGNTQYFGSYSLHQFGYFGHKYVGVDGSTDAGDINGIAKYTKNLVLWGDNSMTTGNNSTYASIKLAEAIKARGGKVTFLGPEFVDTAVAMADKWIKSKPYSDPALIAGMIYYMLENTFYLDGAADTTAANIGTLRANPWLDVDYLDTMIYGFFDSPEYNLVEATGVIGAPNATPVDGTDRNIPAVPAGRSYCSWILGNNNNAKEYDASNYTAKQYSTLAPTMKRWAPCSYPAAANTKYYTKQDFTTPKTPEWASELTGVSVDNIKKLAEIYAKGGPVNTRWSGGFQKQAEGIPNLFSLEALIAVTKNTGIRGGGLSWAPFSSGKMLSDNSISGFATMIAAKYPYSTTPEQKPVASCTAWHTAIKMAYRQELIDGGYLNAEGFPRHIPNWKMKDDTVGVYWDDGGTKALVNWDRDATGKVQTYPEGSAYYFKWVNKDSGADPVKVGFRMIYNWGGNIFMNQHENTNDSREMLEALPLCTSPAGEIEADRFCLVSVDNFLSPSPRWSDYVLPAATGWERQDIISPTGNAPFYQKQAINPPGEAKAEWDIALDLVKTYGALTGIPRLGGAYDVGDGGKPIEALAKAAFQAEAALPYAELTWEEYLKKPYMPSKPDDFSDAPATFASKTVIDAFVAYKTSGMSAPFITSSIKIETNEIDSATGGYGHEYADTTGAPKSSFRMQVYSPVLTWQYKNSFSKWHGYLTNPDQRGQKHKDFENNEIVLEIPIYYDCRDYFMEAYGGFQKNPSNPAQVLNGLDFRLTTTHDRYRSHSTYQETPLLRELNHRVPNHGSASYTSANDWNDYAAVSGTNLGTAASILPLSNKLEVTDDGAIKDINKDIISFQEIWLNPGDFAPLGIIDGDLVLVENPIGAVLCSARLSERCVSGFAGLHQGAWYDPRPLANSYGHKYVDVGGCANTLMASQPSRFDHGNGQQSALVKITKVNY